jgi:hypothetical protein
VRTTDNKTIDERLAFTERALMVLTEDIDRLRCMAERAQLQVHALAREHGVETAQ